MNPHNVPVETTGSPMLGLLLLIGVAFWCWFSSGPLFLRWPLVVLIVLMTSGHWLGGIIGAYAGALAGPVLLFLIMIAGFMVMLRGFGWRPRRQYQADSRYRRGWHGNRW